MALKDKFAIFQCLEVNENLFLRQPNADTDAQDYFDILSDTDAFKYTEGYRSAPESIENAKVICGNSIKHFLSMRIYEWAIVEKQMKNSWRCVMDKKIINLMIERQHLANLASEEEYIALYKDLQPGQNVYWNGFGDPPTLTYRADFNDMEFNRTRQNKRQLIKGRFVGGNLGWIVPDDLEIFGALYKKPLDKPTPAQSKLLELIERESPLNIQQMKEETKMLVKEITPILHRLQEAFLVYEDQHDGEWDRGWYKFTEMFPTVTLDRLSRIDALKILLLRFAYRHVYFDVAMAKSYFKIQEKIIQEAIDLLLKENKLVVYKGGYLLFADVNILEAFTAEPIRKIFAMHRNDFLVKSHEHTLKERFKHSYPDTLYYLLVDGEFCGVVVGKFRYTPEVEDVLLDDSVKNATDKKAEILQAVQVLCGKNNVIKRYMGTKLG